MEIRPNNEKFDAGDLYKVGKFDCGKSAPNVRCLLDVNYEWTQ